MQLLQKSQQLSNPFNTKQFKKLRREWYRKLYSQGFDDIETFSDIEEKDGKIKVNSANGILQRRIDKHKYESRLEYYSWASSILYTHKFTNKLEKRVWELHADGVSYRSIALILKREGIKKDDANKIVKCITQAYKKKLVNR